MGSAARAVRRAAVLIKARDGMDMIVSRGARGKDESRRIVPQGAHVAKALSTQQPALNDGRQMMALPLISRRHRRGLSGEPYQPVLGREVRLALSLTQPAAMAVENARLFDESSARHAGRPHRTYNRRHFMELAHLAFESARRFGQPLTAVMLDVDTSSPSRRVRPSRRRPVLRTLAERCRFHPAHHRRVGRYGGEEFAICCRARRAATRPRSSPSASAIASRRSWSTPTQARWASP